MADAHRPHRHHAVGARGARPAAPLSNPPTVTITPPAAESPPRGGGLCRGSGRECGTAGSRAVWRSRTSRGIQRWWSMPVATSERECGGSEPAPRRCSPGHAAVGKANKSTKEPVTFTFTLAETRAPPRGAAVTTRPGMSHSPPCNRWPPPQTPHTACSWDSTRCPLRPGRMHPVGRHRLTSISPTTSPTTGQGRS